MRGRPCSRPDRTRGVDRFCRYMHGLQLAASVDRRARTRGSQERSWPCACEGAAHETTKPHPRRRLALGVLVPIGGAASTYNELVALDISVTAQWAQVENAYQRRADLITNTVHLT